MVFMHEEDDRAIMDKRKGKVQKADTHWTQKRQMPPLSLLLWCEMVAMHYFIWSSSSLMTVADRQVLVI